KRATNRSAVGNPKKLSVSSRQLWFSLDTFPNSAKDISQRVDLSRRGPLRRAGSPSLLPVPSLKRLYFKNSRRSCSPSGAGHAQTLQSCDRIHIFNRHLRCT